MSKITWMTTREDLFKALEEVARTYRQLTVGDYPGAPAGGQPGIQRARLAFNSHAGRDALKSARKRCDTLLASDHFLVAASKWRVRREVLRERALCEKFQVLYLELMNTAAQGDEEFLAREAAKSNLEAGAGLEKVRSIIASSLAGLSEVPSTKHHEQLGRALFEIYDFVGVNPEGRTFYLPDFNDEDAENLLTLENRWQALNRSPEVVEQALEKLVAKALGRGGSKPFPSGLRETAASMSKDLVLVQMSHLMDNEFSHRSLNQTRTIYIFPKIALTLPAISEALVDVLPLEGITPKVQETMLVLLEQAGYPSLEAAKLAAEALEA